MIVTAALAALLIGAPTNSDWHAAHISALTLARQVDARLNNLSSTKFHGYFQYTGEIGRGFCGAEAEVKNSHVFKIVYPTVGKKEDDGIRWRKWVSNGQVILTQSELRHNQFDKQPYTTRFPGNRSLPSTVLRSWFDDFTHCVLSGIGSQNKPLSEFVKAASKAGLKVSCQEKVVSIQGHKLPYNQILVTNGISAKKPGGLLYEVVIQSQFMLPTSIDNIRMQGNRLYQSSLTQCDWDVSRNQSFPEADFKPDPKLG